MKNKKNKEIGKDATQYGEFISSFFSWITPNRQKENVKRLEKMTKKQENDEK